ncbi:MAG TPA: hypothetical protein VNT31_04200 [Nocardioides sp.]|nr:hypothetical protein [Nocardioides sp.]
MSRGLAWITVCLTVVTFVLCTSEKPATAACSTGATLLEVNASCGDSGKEQDGQAPPDGPDVFIYPACAVKVGGLCGRNLTCTTPEGDGAVMYHVIVAGEYLGTRCIGPGAASDPATITPGQILTAMRRLDWPAPRLVIEPPDGLTLVNFDTNFFTTSTRPVTRRVTLLGQRVTIEATPRQFHWDFGDGTRRTTTDPGAPYPDLRVTHDYLAKGTYRPSLGTTYGGRYRVGNGPWQDIPGTVTIEGDGQALRAIEAQPKLVGH